MRNEPRGEPAAQESETLRADEAFLKRGVAWTVVLAVMLAIGIYWPQIEMTLSAKRDAINAASGVAVALFTAVLTIVAVWQYRALKDQDHRLDKTVDVLAAQQAAMEAIARAVTESAAAARGALDSVNEQKAMQHRAFIANNPPQLEMGAPVLREQPVDGADPVGMIDFTLHNTGGSRAILEESSMRSFVLLQSESLSPRPGYAPTPDRDDDPVAGIEMGPTDAIPVAHAAGSKLLTHYILAHAETDGSKIVFVGYVVYRDDSGRRRKLGFGYFLDPANTQPTFHRWGAAEGYNYST